MILECPFWATLALKLKLIEDNKIPTMATDGVSVLYNREFIEGLDKLVRVFGLAHELGHVMLLHGLRRGSRNPKRWNIAGDLAINLMLKEDGFKIWERALIDDKYAGMNAEQIYEAREKEREERQRNNQPDPNAPPWDQWGDQFDNAMGAELEDILGDPRMTEAQKAEIEETVREAVAAAAATARQAGKLGGGLERFINELLYPKVPWQELLVKYFNRAVRTTETWNRRNRRIRNYYWPGLQTHRMGEVVVIGDTSGSITDHELSQIAAEMGAIMDSVKPSSIRMLWWDTKLAKEEVLNYGDPLEFHPAGGGGTNMAAALEYVEENYDPEVVVLITDGYTPWPNREMNYPLLTICTTDQNVPIGETIRM
jgi:predicted metal-dependent peptidase